MARDWMHYDRLVQSALKGVVRQILRRVQVQGLPGDHHVYVVFRTGHPGVVIPSFLKERYPDEMTIVLQHQFWGLEVLEDRFRVGLSFNKSPQELTIPFAAMKGFFDPSVQFGLQFDIEDVEAPAEGEAPTALIPRGKTAGRALEPIERPAAEAPAPAAPSAGSEAGASGGALPAPETNATKEPAKGEVVSLDSFRKK